MKISGWVAATGWARGEEEHRFARSIPNRGSATAPKRLSWLSFSYFFWRHTRFPHYFGQALFGLSPSRERGEMSGCWATTCQSASANRVVFRTSLSRNLRPFPGHANKGPISAAVAGTGKSVFRHAVQSTRLPSVLAEIGPQAPRVDQTPGNRRQNSDVSTNNAEETETPRLLLGECPGRLPELSFRVLFLPQPGDQGSKSELG
jgi:hypothetical protein